MSPEELLKRIIGPDGKTVEAKSKLVCSCWQKVCFATKLRSHICFYSCSVQGLRQPIWSNYGPFFLHFTAMYNHLQFYECHMTGCFSCMSFNLESVSGEILNCERVFAFQMNYIVIMAICMLECGKTLETLHSCNFG